MAGTVIADQPVLRFRQRRELGESTREVLNLHGWRTMPCGWVACRGSGTGPRNTRSAAQMPREAPSSSAGLLTANPRIAAHEHVLSAMLDQPTTGCDDRDCLSTRKYAVRDSAGPLRPFAMSLHKDDHSNQHRSEAQRTLEQFCRG